MLTQQEIDALFADLMRELSNRREPMALKKPELRAVVESIHNWLQASQTQQAFNNFLPVNGQGLPAKIKRLMFYRVVEAMSKKDFV